VLEAYWLVRAPGADLRQPGGFPRRVRRFNPRAGWIQSLDKPYPDLLGPLETSLPPVNPAVLAALRDHEIFASLHQDHGAWRRTRG